MSEPSPILVQAIERQQAYWRRGERLLVEELISSQPELRTPDALLELLYSEAMLREECGEHAGLEEYQQRFPALAAALAIQWQVHRALAGSITTLDHKSAATRAESTAAGRIGRYEVQALLGKGGMGVAYRAWDPQLKRVVALKTLRAGSQADADELTRFRTEAEAIARIRHPNIVQVFDVGEHDGQPFFAMEYCDGGSLAERLNGTPLPAGEAASVVAQITQAIAAAHAQQIIHRDLKPANVLLVTGERQESDGVAPNSGATTERESGSSPAYLRPPPAGTVKVSDFGLAKKLDAEEQQTRTGAVMGTPSYMAPEQASGTTSAIGAAADIYALGAILYECLTGRPPFRGARVADTLDQVRFREPVPVRQLQSRCPRDLETICLKCLEKEPAKRYSTALALAEDLNRFLHEQPIRARPPSLGYRFGKFARRHKGLVAAGGVAALAIVFALIMLSLSLVQSHKAAAAAATAERETRRRLAESFAGTAQLGVQRGDWRQALENYERALAAGYQDSVGMRLHRVRALDALNEYEAAFEEVEALARRSDLGDHRGAVLLWQGDLLLLRDPTKALPLVRDAVAAGLAAADKAYAMALLAETSPAAVSSLERALEHNPYHHRANGMLSMTLILLGRLDEARVQAAASAKLFPQDPTFRLHQAMILALSDKLAAAHNLLDKTRSQLAEDQVAFMHAGLDLLNVLYHFDDVEQKPGKLQQVLWKAGLRAGQLPQSSFKKLESVLATLSPPPVLSMGLGRLPEVIMAKVAAEKLDTKTLDSLIDELTDAVKVHPEGLLHYLRGGMLVLRAGDNDPRWEEAERAFLAAAATPSIARLQRSALLEAVRIEAFLAHPNWPRASAQTRTRFATNLRKLLTLGELPAGDTEYFSRFAENALKDIELARQLLAQLERQVPGDPEAPRRRARFELRSGACSLAIDAAQRALKLRPRDPEGTALYDQAASKLRDQAKSLAPK